MIKILSPDDFEKCSNIWDIKKCRKMAHRFYDEIISGNRITFIYSRGGEFIGEGSIVFDTGDPDYTILHRRIYFSRLIVKKEYRRKGIGRELCRHIIEYVTELGYTEMSIGVDIDNFAAIKLYQSIGFDNLIFVGEDSDGKYFKLLKKL